MTQRPAIPDGDRSPAAESRTPAVGAARVLVAIRAAAMLATGALGDPAPNAPVSALVFDSSAILSGEVWRLLTGGLVHPPSFGLLLELALLAWAGRGVEDLAGRRAFLWLCLLLYFIPPLCLVAVGPWLPLISPGETGAVAFFVAFARLRAESPPRPEIPFARIAAALVSLQTLVAVAVLDWPALLGLWTACGCAWGFACHALTTRPTRPPTNHALPRASVIRQRSASSPNRVERKAVLMAEIDALLDKINRAGLAGLTAVERARLATARDRLVRLRAARPDRAAGPARTINPTRP